MFVSWVCVRACVIVLSFLLSSSLYVAVCLHICEGTHKFTQRNPRIYTHMHIYEDTIHIHIHIRTNQQEDEHEDGEDLCNIEFSLGYGAMMLLTNTRLHMKRGKRYGLCGANGCGKSTLMKAIVNGQVCSVCVGVCKCITCMYMYAKRARW